MLELPAILNVLLLHEPNAERRAQVQSVTGHLRVTEIPPADVAGDGGSLWPPGGAAARRPGTTRAERDAALRDAHVILLGLPYPTVLYPRTKSLLWLHHPNAGVSNLRQSDMWGARLTVTTSRGANAALPIAESAIAGALMFARGLHIAARGSMDRRHYRQSVSVAGKTVGIVGLGGIGGHVARLARALNMRVIATRRSATTQRTNVDGVDELLPPAELHHLLAQSDYVIICAMLTEETERLIDAPAFAAMKMGAVIINVARGEIIDEQALLAALDSGRLRGAYLDVYDGELSGTPPPAALTEHAGVVLTPHVSGVADNPGPRGFDLFLENLKRFVDGEPLTNVVDWERGY